MRLIQEDYLGDPWRVLVCCILLNRTQGQTARSVIDEFFVRWPTAADCAEAPHEQLCTFVGRLGLKKRGLYLKLMSRQYLYYSNTDLRDRDIELLAGCGRYAREAWDMLVLGRRDFVPQDSKLRLRMEELYGRENIESG